jgi:peptide/nickel transport system permease protein
MTAIRGADRLTVPPVVLPRSRRRRRHPPIISLSIFAALICVAIFAPLIAPESPLKINLAQASQAPFFMKGGSTAHLLGTDNLGRDILSRLIYGSRTTLGLAAMVLVIGAVIGVSVGLASGYIGRATDMVVQRLVEAILSLPTIMVALVFAFLLGQSFTTVVVILAPFIAARFARMVRGDVLAIRGSAYVELAQVAGASTFRIIRKHILPNVIGTIIVIATLEIGQLILLEASLSFLGVGVPPPTPEWGLMVSEGEQFLATKFWISLFPGLAIVASVLAINLIGDWLRDYLDPKRSERG